MSILDSVEEISNIDKQNVLGSVDSLPKQCLDAWEQASKVEVPDNYKKIRNLVMTGMGGSGLGARIIESVYSETLNYPIVRINDYHLPGFVNQDTLVMCSSYSGNTEETVNTAKQAIERKARWVAIGTGGNLLDIAEYNQVPFYKIKPTHNPSNQPRMAIGYSVIGQLSLASKAGLFKITKKDVNEFISAMQKIINANKVEIDTVDNPAKQLAERLVGKNIFYISSHHLSGAVHTINNQLNENTKVFSADFQIPELNHHLMEGLKHPKENPQRLSMFFANSDLYPKRIKKRTEITMDVVEKNNIEYFEYKPSSETKLAQAFELIQFGAYVNFYLAILYRQNPAPIPWVDYFKKKLGQPLGK